MTRLPADVLADYDARILAALREKGPMSRYGLCCALGVFAATPAIIEAVVVRRLQALSRKDLVTCPYNSKGGRWMVREVKP